MTETEKSSLLTIRYGGAAAERGEDWRFFIAVVGNPGGQSALHADAELTWVGKLFADPPGDPLVAFEPPGTFTSVPTGTVGQAAEMYTLPK